MRETKAGVFARLPWLDGIGATPVAAVAAIGDVWLGANNPTSLSIPTATGGRAGFGGRCFAVTSSA